MNAKDIDELILQDMYSWLSDEVCECEGRWDGERYWGSQHPDEAARHLDVLRPMLANYPELPAGYDGWWRF